MPDRKITELAPIDSVSAGDLILVIDDPGVVPVSRKATVSQLLSNIPESALALSDNTIGNATTARHGFLSRLPGGTTDILRGDGTFGPATLPTQSGQTLVGRGLEAAGAPHAVTVGAGLVFTGPTALDVADIYVKRGVAETAASPLTISSSYYPSLVLRDSDAAVDAKDWYLRHENATGRFVVQAINDANTVLQSVPLELDRAGNVYLGPTVGTNFRAIGTRGTPPGPAGPGLELWVSGGQGYLHAYNSTTGGYLPIQIYGESVECRGSLKTTSPIYPGTAAGGASQATWYLAGNPTYGLFTNTGLYVTWNLWTGGGLSAAGVGTFGGRVTCDSLTVSNAQNEVYFIGYSHARLHLKETSQAPGNQTWTIMNHQAQLIISATPDAAGTAWNSGGYITFGRDASMTTTRGGSITSGWNLSSTAPIYPGRLDTGWTTQGGWYLASHGNYGLYINTGLYVAGAVWTTDYISSGTSMLVATTLNVGGTIVGGSHIHSGHYFYPGAVTNPGAIQSAWYLGAHSSYGLYSNTGFYLESGVWCSQITVRGGVAFQALTSPATDTDYSVVLVHTNGAVQKRSDVISGNVPPGVTLYVRHGLIVGYG